MVPSYGPMPSLTHFDVWALGLYKGSPVKRPDEGTM